MAERRLKVLLLTRYDRAGPSSRLRQYQYLDDLRKAGIDVTPAPLFTGEYISDLYSGKRRPFGSVAKAYLRRIYTLKARAEYDLLWVEYEVLPWFCADLESMALGSGTPYVLELDDAVFHRYDLHPNWLVRRYLGRKLDILMRRASMVIAGNSYLASRAEAAGASRVEQVPTAVDVERFRPGVARSGGPFTIGWIGSPVTARYLAALQPVLSRLGLRREVLFVAVGCGDALPAGLPARVETWSEETEVEALQAFDVGVMPLSDGPWERGKCGLKIIQYHACGLPAVASPVGANSEIIQDGVNGFLPRDVEEWVASLERLCDDVSLRRRMGEAGRESVRKKYATAVVGPRLASCLENAARVPRRR